MRLFKQQKAYLKNGELVREGDLVTFINSDGNICTKPIERRKDGTLFFWNSTSDIDDYHSAVKERKGE